MQKSNQRGQVEMGRWVGGTILYFHSIAIQLACVNCPVFKVENNIVKLGYKGMSATPHS
jgi:hypothetical protein